MTNVFGANTLKNAKTNKIEMSKSTMLISNGILSQDKHIETCRLNMAKTTKPKMALSFFFILQTRLVFRKTKRYFSMLIPLLKTR